MEKKKKKKKGERRRKDKKYWRRQKTGLAGKRPTMMRNDCWNEHKNEQFPLWFRSEKMSKVQVEPVRFVLSNADCEPDTLCPCQIFSFLVRLLLQDSLFPMLILSLKSLFGICTKQYFTEATRQLWLDTSNVQASCFPFAEAAAILVLSASFLCSLPLAHFPLCLLEVFSSKPSSSAAVCSLLSSFCLSFLVVLLLSMCRCYSLPLFCSYWTLWFGESYPPTL